MYQLALPTLAHLEDVLATELTALGGQDISTGRRVVTCRGDRTLVYRANLELRTALRVLINIDNFHAPHEQGLYDRLRTIDWSQYLRPEGALYVDVVNADRNFRNSHFLALLTKDAIVDQFRERHAGARPSVSKERPDLRIHLRIDRGGNTTVSLDSSGEGLHRRGYRRRTGGAPLNEVLAAGLVALGGYTGDDGPFVDPMCGSGTIVAEAATVAARQAPGLFRDFGFQRWPEFDADEWATIRQAALERRRQPPHPILANDIDGSAVAIARATLDRAKVAAHVDFSDRPFAELRPPVGKDVPPGTLITNPPYEMRLKTGDITGFYQEIGDAFKQNWAGYTAWLISANPQAVKSVGLRTSRKVVLFNGPTEVRFCRYDLYQGSKE